MIRNGIRAFQWMSLCKGKKRRNRVRFHVEMRFHANMLEKFFMMRRIARKSRVGDIMKDLGCLGPNHI